ncbi:hypothetical protein [Crossiella sp. CA198]|uniref:hypothetical protein n=1 Tax=Crossiella sp. CA198 TaxID=3455607 RepID=UPI003F8CFD2F
MAAAAEAPVQLTGDSGDLPGQDEPVADALVPATAQHHPLVGPGDQVGVTRDASGVVGGHIAEEEVQPTVRVLGAGAQVHAGDRPPAGVHQQRPALGVQQVRPAPRPGGPGELADPDGLQDLARAPGGRDRPG